MVDLYDVKTISEMAQRIVASQYNPIKELSVARKKEVKLSYTLSNPEI